MAVLLSLMSTLVTLLVMQVTLTFAVSWCDSLGRLPAPLFFSVL